MARLEARAFVFLDVFQTNNDGTAYQFGDTCRNGSWDTTTNPGDRGIAYRRRNEKLPRWWRVVKRRDGWDGYLFRERNRESRSDTNTNTLRGTKLPQAVTDKLAAIAMLTCLDKPIVDFI